MNKQPVKVNWGPAKIAEFNRYAATYQCFCFHAWLRDVTKVTQINERVSPVLLPIFYR